MSPVFSQSALSPYSSPTALFQTLRAANNVTYRWFNEAGSSDSYVTVWSVLRNGRHDDLRDSMVPARRFRDSILSAAATFDGDFAGRPVLFMTEEQFVEVGDLLVSRTPWEVGLGIYALTGITLLHGVADDQRTDYGFENYGPGSARLTSAEVDFDSLCEYQRPVILLKDIETLTFETRCYPS